MHLPVLQTSALVGPSETWRPREQFSPTQLSIFSECERKWAFSYLFGIRAVKKGVGPMLGSIIHACLEGYLKGRKIWDLQLDTGTARELSAFTPAEVQDLCTEAPKRALAGLHLLPRLDECATVEIEQWIAIDTRAVLPHLEPLVIVGKIDLSVLRSGIWYLYDHKSTRGRDRKKDGKPADPWAYVKTPEEILRDPQGVFYPLDRMLKHGMSELWARWSYFLTDRKKHPAAKAVDVHFTHEQVFANAVPWLLIGDEMRRYVRAASTLTPDEIPPPAKLPPDPESPCLAFGGCPYRAEIGGPCRVGQTLDFGSMFLQSTAGAKDMSLLAALNEAQGVTANAVQAQAATAAAIPAQAPMSFGALGAAPAAPTVALPEQVVPQAPAQPVRPELPAGWVYNELGQPVPIQPPAPVQAPAAVAPAIPPTPVQAPAAPTVPEAPAPKRRGRPPKADNAAAGASAPPISPSAIGTTVTAPDPLIDLAPNPHKVSIRVKNGTFAIEVDVIDPAIADKLASYARDHAQL